jgi:FkbM family methyltransferase
MMNSLSANRIGKNTRMDLFIHPRFDSVYRQHPLVLVDVGARGGLKSNWAAARRHLRLVGFEPDKREFGRLSSEAEPAVPTTFLDIALHNRTETVRFHIARDRGLSSMFEPDRPFLDAFPEARRFDTVDVQEVEADTLDNQMRARGIGDIDFIKADTQGSELFVLQGAREALASTATGVEVEVEFTAIYKGQPLFADVDVFLRSLGFLLFDLRPCYWKRAAGRGMGGPRGQIIWADALYLKSLPALRAAIAALDPDSQKSKVLRALSVALLYGYCDYAFEIAQHAGAALTTDDRAVIEAELRRLEREQPGTTRFPGRRHVAAVLHRLWKILRPRDQGWSVSGARLGNLR